MKISHDVLKGHPTETEIANLVDLVKTGCSRWGLAFGDPTAITKAIESAQWQKRNLA